MKPLEPPKRKRMDFEQTTQVKDSNDLWNAVERLRTEGCVDVVGGEFIHIKLPALDCCLKKVLLPQTASRVLRSPSFPFLSVLLALIALPGLYNALYNLDDKAQHFRLLRYEFRQARAFFDFLDLHSVTLRFSYSTLYSYLHPNAVDSKIHLLFSSNGTVLGYGVCYQSSWPVSLFRLDYSRKKNQESGRRRVRSFLYRGTRRKNKAEKFLIQERRKKPGSEILKNCYQNRHSSFFQLRNHLVTNSLLFTVFSCCRLPVQSVPSFSDTPQVFLSRYSASGSCQRPCSEVGSSKHHPSLLVEPLVVVHPTIITTSTISSLVDNPNIRCLYRVGSIQSFSSRLSDISLVAICTNRKGFL
ncbi:hypothetical protein BJ508DRAFT_102711 [Ascobolus immersus RN42]|uniref:Uncharacterized protein n=1 Tax=Ascobolus immersus RN42 TaxID=1160509 RepID=A0A3N4ICL7_ASCIM|nr:hypothetical protein BJ508DRAFT_102711 [Ascobolus immersus RN42]